MRYIAAYLLSVLGGNENPSEDDIKRILSSVGIEADGACLKKVVSQLNGKNIEELIAEGRQKLATVPGGGAILSAGGTAVTASATGTTAPEIFKDEKPEAKKEESEPESDEDMGFGLFD